LAISPATANDATRPEFAVASVAGDPGDGGVAATQDGIDPGDRDKVLGPDWKQSGDVAHVVLADESGLAVLRAKESAGYAWGVVSRLPVDPTAETDLWISNSCVTSSGTYMAVVYGTRAVTNSENGLEGGAHAAIVNLKSGAVTDLGAGYTMAYFNPGCGAGDTVTITRYTSGFASTLVAVIDATSGKVVRKVELQGEITSAISMGDSTILASGREGIVAVGTDEKQRLLVPSKYLTYDLTLDENSRLAYVSLGEDEKTSTVSLVDARGGAKPRVVASGPITEVGVQASAHGGFYFTGQNLKADIADVPEIQIIAQAGPHSAISSNGHLVVDGLLPPGVARAESAADASAADPRIEARTASSGTSVEFSIKEPLPAAALEGESELKPSVLPGPVSGVTTPPVSTTHHASRLLTTGDPHDPTEAERYCAVSRNDPNNQVYQPKPRQVEWAVDRAVNGQLTESRPANWRGLGMPTCVPQTYFPKVALVGGGTIPPQILLGVLMQESNIWQASRFTAPGNTGNPLVGDYYGNTASTSIWNIDYSLSDCGYGVGQVTDGMRLAGHERPGETALPVNQQRAVALDYVTNVAASARLLEQKWN